MKPYQATSIVKTQLVSRLRGQAGITGLETAIILIAFVVVASVFAFTVLSTGLFSAERGKETVHAGLKEARGSMALRGSVIANKDGGNSQVGTLVFIVTNAISGEPIDLTAPGDSDDDGIPESTSTHKAILSYTDETQNIADVAWTVTYLGDNDADDLLELGEKAQITVKLAKAITETAGTQLGTDKEFTIEFKPPKGAVLIVERTTPSGIDTVMDLK